MKKNMFKKILAFIIILLFIGICFLPSINSCIENYNKYLLNHNIENSLKPFVDIYFLADINITFDGDLFSIYVVNIPGGNVYWFIYANSDTESYSNATINWLGGPVKYSPVKNLNIFINGFRGENTLEFGKGVGGNLSGFASFIILTGNVS